MIPTNQYPSRYIVSKERESDGTVIAQLNCDTPVVARKIAQQWRAQMRKSGERAHVAIYDRDWEAETRKELRSKGFNV